MQTRPPIRRGMFPGLYAIGSALIARTESGWKVIDSDGDTFARAVNFRAAVRLARRADEATRRRCRSVEG